MSDLEEGDEDEDFMSGSDDDEDYKNKLKSEADKLKRKRMQARPSTIVQVSTGPLEFHLQSMKKQLKEHTALINHPPFLDDLMLEVNKISGLVRKIEHCQVDINNVRETLTCAPKGSPAAEGPNLSLTDRVEHLFKDLEMVRSVLRRVDVHHALDATVLVRVKKLAKNLKSLKDFTEKMYTNNMKVIQDELKGEIKSVNTRIQQMDDLTCEKLEEVFERIKRTEDNIHQGQKEETELLSQKVEFLEENLTKDFYSFKGQIDGQMEATRLIATKAFMEISKGSLSSGMKKIEDCIRRITIGNMRKRFIRWRNFDPDGILGRARSMVTLMRRAHRKMFLRSALFEWKRLHWLQEARQKMRVYLTSIIQKWRDQAFPLVAKRFQKWKRYCVFMKFHDLEKSAPVPDQQQQSQEKEILSNQEFDGLVGHLNPSMDIEGSFQLTGMYVDRIYNKINHVLEELNESKETTRRIGHRVEGARGDLMETLDNRCGEIEKYQKTSNKKLTTGIRDLQISQVDFEKSTAKNFTKSTNETNRLETAVYELTIKVEDQGNRLERLFALHQKMLHRMDAIEAKQKSHESQISTVNSVMASVSDTNARTDAEMILLKQLTEKSISELGEEVAEVKAVSTDACQKLQAVLSNQSHEHSTLSSLSKEFKTKVANIESWLNTTAPKPPSPKLLVSLALKFEDRAVEKHCHDPAHLFSVSMSTELAKDIATCAHWLVYHIVEATDVDVLTRVMKGPQDSAAVYDHNDPSNSLNPVSPKEKKSEAIDKKKSNHLTHEEFCVTTREGMLMRYLEKFQKLLAQARDEVGIVRKEARAMFLKRFIDAIDLAIQKHDAIVLSTSSALGRNPGHVSGRPSDSGGPPACMACDRPLRMRTTTRSIGELYDKLQQSGQKSSAVKREVMRNQILTPQNTPSSPVHNYKFSSDFPPPDKAKPMYTIERNNNANDDDFQEEFGMDEVTHGRKGQSVVRIKPASSPIRPQSAPRPQLTSSQSATQLKTPHFPSPSKGGGFRGVQSQSQDALATSLANELLLDSSIPPRHTMEDMPTTSRQLIGKCNEAYLSREAINDSLDEQEAEEREVTLDNMIRSSSGLKGSFTPGKVSGTVAHTHL